MPSMASAATSRGLHLFCVCLFLMVKTVKMQNAVHRKMGRMINQCNPARSRLALTGLEGERHIARIGFAFRRGKGEHIGGPVLAAEALVQRVQRGIRCQQD